MKKYEASLRAARAVFPNQPPDDEKDDGGKERVTAKKRHHHVEDRIAQRLVDETKQTDIKRLQPVHERSVARSGAFEMKLRRAAAELENYAKCFCP